MIHHVPHHGRNIINYVPTQRNMEKDLDGWEFFVNFANVQWNEGLRESSSFLFNRIHI